MDTDIKKVWVEALRSGEYKQGWGLLRRMQEEGEDQFCCLGVLCDLYIKRTGKGMWADNGNFIQNLGDEDEFVIEDILPIEVAEWAGIEVDNSGPKRLKRWNGATAINPTIEYRDKDDDPDDINAIEITELNDGFVDHRGHKCQLGFKELADLIEKRW